MFNNIVEGEVIKIVTPDDNDSEIKYACEVLMPDMTKIILTNCVQVSGFGGGIENYSRIRLRTRSDSDFDKDGELNSYKASVGDRVYIAFVNGNIRYPLIIGYSQHPQQTQEEVVSSTSNVASAKQFLGFREVIDEDGSVYFVRKGAPEVKYQKADFFSALPSLSGGKSSKLFGKPNSSVKDAPDSEVVVMAIEKGGIFSVRDSQGGLIELDHNKSRVYISDNDVKSTEYLSASSMASDADFVNLNRDDKSITLNARGLLAFLSQNDRNDETSNNYSHKIGGTNTVQVSGDINYSGKSFKLESSQDIQIVSSGGEILIKGPVGQIKIDKTGKFVIGTSSAELITILAETLKAFVDNASSLVATSAGPGTLNPSLLSVITKSQTLLESIKG